MLLKKVILLCSVLAIARASFSAQSGTVGISAVTIGSAVLNGALQKTLVLSLPDGNGQSLNQYYFVIGPRWVDYVMAKCLNDPASAGNVLVSYDLSAPEGSRVAYGIKFRVDNTITEHQPIASGTYGGRAVYSWSIMNSGGDNDEFKFSLLNLGSDFYSFRIPFSESTVELVKDYWIANIIRTTKVSVQFDATGGGTITKIVFAPN